MPFRNAHYALLALFPLILIAFWPGYFGQIRSVPFALHAHGLTAMAWLILLTWQSWTIHAGRRQAHRAAGLAIFVAVPLFAMGGMLVIRAMAKLALDQADPFHSAYGLPLAMDDAIGLVVFLALVGMAVAHRRRVALHGAAMLATALMVLPPILGRLLPLLPGMPDPRTDIVRAFGIAFEGAQAIAVALALLLAWRNPRSARPFLFAAAAIAVQSLLFETIGKSGAWATAMRSALIVPASGFALAGLAIGLSTLWLAWRRSPPRGRPILAAP